MTTTTRPLESRRRPYPLTVLLALATGLLAPRAAQARCTERTTVGCVGPGGCEGERTCQSGYLSGCQCATRPVPCRICNRPSVQDATGRCKPLTETCNSCDDNQDGRVDENLFCLGTGPFVPRCTPTTTTPIKVNLGSTGARLPTDPLNGFLYQNNISYLARVHTSPQVQTLSLRFGDVAVDFFDTFTAFNWANHQLTDQSRSHQRTVPFVLAGQGQAGGLDLRFSTDRSRTSFGWSIEEALVDCGTQTTSSVATVDENERDTFGLLTGTDDVVFFRIPVGAEPLSVWAEGVRSVADFDLDVYARYDSLPERDVFDFSSRVANRSDEWINVDAPRSGHALFVAVHSRAGAGSFNLRWAKVKPGQRWSSTFSRPLRVATSFIANPNQLAQIRDMISGSQRFVVGLTEGKVQLREVELYNRAGDCTCDGKGCDVCVRGIPGRAFCFGGMATLFSDEWSSGFAGARTMGHELGHCVLGLNDEYRDHGNAGESCFHGDTLCAATAMGNHWRASNLCNAHDHGRDVNRPGHTCTNCALFGQTCSLGSCNSCFLRGSSDWEDLVSTGKVFSRPLGTANANTYESYLAMPFSISNR